MYKSMRQDFYIVKLLGVMAKKKSKCVPHKFWIKQKAKSKTYPDTPQIS